VNPVDVLFVIAGLALLIAGGEALVRGAGTLASRAGISPLVTGLVVVSAATSAPELAVSVGAVLNGEPDLAVGNVIGSNIANILLVLGVAALLTPLVIKRQLVRFDIPIMLALSLLMLFLSLDGVLSFSDGLLLFGVVALHAVASIAIGKREVAGSIEQPESMPLNSKPVSLWLAILLLLAGIGILVSGSQLLVVGAVNIATALGVGSLVIGLTVVAIGTSLPELATAIVAIRKGETDMAVGNIVGSNLFNIGLVLGIPAMIFGDGIPIATAVIAIDLPLMLAAALALLPIAFTGFVIARWEGAVFLALYVSYTAYLILDSTGHDAAVGFNGVMLSFVLPLLAISLVAFTSFELGVLRERKIMRQPKSNL
jgi:cation:H+ antiporter